MIYWVCGTLSVN